MYVQQFRLISKMRELEKFAESSIAKLEQKLQLLFFDRFVSLNVSFDLFYRDDSEPGVFSTCSIRSRADTSTPFVFLRDELSITRAARKKLSARRNKRRGNENSLTGS